MQIHPGPVVTTYEFKPDAGVKYSKITGLADDLCLAMQAESVLIDRIAGQVHRRHPDSKREPRDDFAARAARVGAVRAVDVEAVGGAWQDDPRRALHRGPRDHAPSAHRRIDRHRQIGGPERACSRACCSRATPEDVRLIMIDPKRLELGMYEDIPHLLTPVVVDPKQASNALRWAVREMEERYKTLAAEGVRNIEQYNRNMRILHRREGTGRRTGSRPRRCRSSSS